MVAQNKGKCPFVTTYNNGQSLALKMFRALGRSVRAFWHSFGDFLVVLWIGLSL